MKPTRQQTKRIAWIVVIGIFGIMGLSARGDVTRAQSGALATLDPVTGLIQHQTAFANPQDPAAWQTVIAPLVVSEGDRIRTDAAGLAYLTFFEGIQTEIRANTLVVVSTLELPADGSITITLDVLVGATYNQIEAALGPNDRFEVHTPGATAVVRGTEWWTLVAPNGESTFVTERGVVEVLFHQLRSPVSPSLGATSDTSDDTAAAPAPGAAWGNFAALSSVREGDTVRASRDGASLEPLRDLVLPDRNTLPIRSLVVATCGDGVCRPVERRLCPADCLDRSELLACGDGICDPDAGESLIVCDVDCGPFAGAQCGNGVCDPDESGLTCPSDCAPEQYFSPVDPSLCGNDVCDPSESALTCPADCQE